LSRSLTGLGGRISGAGTSTLEVEGVDGLKPVRHTTVGDRIVAGTWAFGAAMTRRDAPVHGVPSAFLDIALDKLVATGAAVEPGDESFRVRMEERPRSVDIVT